MRPETPVLSQAVSMYIEDRQDDYSSGSWANITGRLRNFQAWVAETLQPDPFLTDLDDHDMRSYFKRLRPPAKSPGAHNNARQYMIGFWDYCRQNGWMQADVMREVKRLNDPKRPRLQLSADELLAALEGATPRDRIALAIGMNVALRAADIEALTIGAVNLGDGTLSVWVEKVDRWEVKPITAELREEIMRWYRHYALVMGLPSLYELPNDWTLVPPVKSFQVNPSDPQSPRGFKYLPESHCTHLHLAVHRALTRLGHPTHREGFHTLRRSTLRVAYELAMQDGVPDPIRVPQTIAGHASRRTTELYLGVTHEKQLVDDMMRGRSYLTRAAALQRVRNESGEEEVARAKNSA